MTIKTERRTMISAFTTARTTIAIAIAETNVAIN